MIARYRINDINKIGDRIFFFDANVLIYLYYAPESKQTSDYSKIFAGLLKQKALLIIDSHVVSEFINSILRIEYKNTGNVNSISFKQYRNSSEGKRAVMQTYNIAKLILKQFKVDNNILSNSDIEYLLSIDSLDFNDKIIEKHCLDNGYILVTNDADLLTSSAEILTANHRLLI